MTKQDTEIWQPVRLLQSHLSNQNSIFCMCECAHTHSTLKLWGVLKRQLGPSSGCLDLYLMSGQGKQSYSFTARVVTQTFSSSFQISLSLSSQSPWHWLFHTPRWQTCPDIFKVPHHCCSSLALQWLFCTASTATSCLLCSLSQSFSTRCSCRRLLAQHCSGISTRLLPSAFPIQLFHLEFSSLCAVPCFNALLNTLTCSCGFPTPSNSVIFSHSASCLSDDAWAGSFLDSIK